MNPIRKVFDWFEPHVQPGGRLERLQPLYEAADTFFYTPADVTAGQVHVRDSADLKRLFSNGGQILTLSQISTESNDVASLFYFEPTQNDRSIQSSRISQNDSWSC